MLREKTAMVTLLVTAAGTVLAVAAEPAARPDVDPFRAPSKREVELRREFEGAYTLHAPESTGVKRWSITATPGDVEVFDGRSLHVWAYNGRIPGPTLRIRLGETVHVTFKNELPQSTTIHWHGVRVPNPMDGVPHVTQPPVEPGDTFVYEFTPKDPGTYWFHPHVRSAEQVERGLYGVLIVDDAEPLPYSRDVMWVLDDWRIAQDGEIDPRFLTRSDLAHDGRWGNVITVNGRTDTELTVRAGERIRLRLLNAANGRVFVPSFWPLDARVVAVDGKYVAEPFVPQRFEMAPGNRLDLDIRIDPQQAGKLFTVRNRWRPRPDELARIRVTDEVVPTPDFEAPSAEFVPTWAGTQDIEPRLDLVLDSRAGGPHGIQWTLNDEAYAPTNTPYDLVYDEWAKLRFVNASARLHPMHIHGQFFKVLSRNGRPVDEPYWRDTVLTHPKETIEVGTVPLDVGTWMLHCHILEHAESGMMTLVSVQPRALPDPAGR